MWYIEVMKLDKEFKFRISSEMLKLLDDIARQRGPGSKIADLVREAIHKTYFAEVLEPTRKEVVKKKKAA